MPNQKQLNNYLKVLQFAVIWLLFGTIYSIIEYGILGDSVIYPSTQNLYDARTSFIYIPIGSMLFGLLLGVIETYGINSLFKGKSFLFKILIKSLLYLILIFLFLVAFALFAASDYMGVHLFHPEVLDNLERFVTTFSFYSIAIYISVVCVIVLFFAEIREYLGMFVFLNFLRGKYHKPRVEERIFMFMDMKSSTTIAETLGHVKYYEMLNKYYSDMSDAILNNYGEIYQYVGDEVILTWPLKKGIEKNACINCFVQIKELINSKAEYYQNKFGVVPKFKAAAHCGKVTSGEIGQLKKEIVFTGDVLNTTSRIQEKCNEYESELLISGKLLKLLEYKDQFSTKKLGSISLRGKQQEVKIIKIMLNGEG